MGRGLVPPRAVRYDVRDEALVAGTIANTNGLLVILAKLVARGVFDRDDLKHAAVTSHPDDVMKTAVERAEDGLRPGGFGMLIVRQIVDELVYNERGNEVLLIKHLK